MNADEVTAAMARAAAVRGRMTDRQLEALRLIAIGHVRYRDLATALGAASSNAAATHVRVLALRGFVSTSSRSASIALTPKGWVALGPCEHMVAGCLVPLYGGKFGPPNVCPWCRRLLVPEINQGKMP
jgi:hypothetical protein